MTDGTHTPDDVDKAVALFGDRFPGVAVYQPGEGPSSVVVDPRGALAGARTPIIWKPIEDALCRALNVQPDRVRLKQASETRGGPVTLWECLSDRTGAVLHFVVTAPATARQDDAAGAPRLRLVFAWSPEGAQRRFGELYAQLDGLPDVR